MTAFWLQQHLLCPRHAWADHWISISIWICDDPTLWPHCRGVRSKQNDTFLPRGSISYHLPGGRRCGWQLVSCVSIQLEGMHEQICHHCFTVHMNINLSVYFKKTFKVLTLLLCTWRGIVTFSLHCTASNLVNADLLLSCLWKSPCLSVGEESSWPSMNRSWWWHIVPWHFLCDTSLLAMLPRVSPGRKDTVFLTSSLWLVTPVMTAR